MTDSLHEFLTDRVLATRQVHHVQYPLDLDGPAVGVMLDCAEDALTCVVLPTFVRGVMHLEIHCFVDGQRVEPEVLRHIPANGLIELTLRRP